MSHEFQAAEKQCPYHSCIPSWGNSSFLQLSWLPGKICLRPLGMKGPGLEGAELSRTNSHKKERNSEFCGAAWEWGRKPKGKRRGTRRDCRVNQGRKSSKEGAREPRQAETRQHLLAWWRASCSLLCSRRAGATLQPHPVSSSLLCALALCWGLL